MLGIILFISVALGVGVIQEVTKGIEEFAIEKARGDLNLGERFLNEKYPGDWIIKNGHLYKGDVKLNDQFEVVDEIGEATGDTVTIFQKDTRISTNVQENGERAVGTKISPEIAQVVINERKQYFGEANVAGHTYQTAYRPILDKTGEVIGIFYVGAPQTIIDQILSSFMKGMIVVLLAAMLISSIIVMWFTKRLTKRLTAISTALDHSKNGDFTIEVVDHVGDELTDLSNSYNSMKENLSIMIHQVIETSRQVAVASQELTMGAEHSSKATEGITQSIQEVADGAEKQAVSVEESSVAIEEVTIGINYLAKNSSSISKSAVKTIGHAEQGKVFVEKTVQQMNAIQFSVHESGKAIRLLNESSQKIGSITETITDIANQTNLLALNAAIEAARAGEHGKGFSVVAAEVRKLAEQSQQSSTQISELIKAIQGEMLLTKDSMEQVEHDVNEGLGIVGKTAESFKEITNATEAMGNQIDEMVAIADQMSSSAQEVSATINGITGIIRQTSGNTQSVSVATEEQLAQMEEISASAYSLSEIANKLQKIVSEFKV